MTARPHREIDEVAITTRVASLRRKRAATGVFGSVSVDLAAASVGVSRRTMYRRLERPRRPPRSSWTPPPKVLAAIRQHDGNVTEAYKQLVKDGEITVHEKTLRRALSALPTPVQLGLKRGIKAVAQGQLYLEMPAGRRNDRWQLDHTQLQIWVLDAGRMTQPWLTLFIDEATRYFVAWSVTVTPRGAADTDSILATLADAIERCGKPKAVRFDQGADFVSPTFTNALHRLDIAADPCPSGAAYKKGKVERWVGVLKATVLPSLPGYFARPRKAG